MRQLSTLLLSLLLCATCLAQPDSRPGPYTLTLAKINAAIGAGVVTVNSVSLDKLTAGTVGVDLQMGAKVILLGSTATAGTGNQLAGTSTQLWINATTKTNFAIGGSGKVEVSSSGLKISGSSELLDLGTSGSTVSGATQAISGTSTGLQYNSTTSTPHKFYVAGTEKYRLASTLLEAPAISIGGTLGSSVDPSAGGLALTGKFYLSTTQTPASAGATGTTGQICWDSSYIYVCTATNTWKRAAIATW